MLAVLSPAKTLDYARPIPELSASEPRFGEDAQRLAFAAAKLGARRIASLMDVSPALATLNAERFAAFETLPARPALFAFAGDVYTGFDARSADVQAIGFAQDHVRILSGLYGLLRPLDAMRPYRLEMGTRWAPRRADLYAYWQDRIADLLAEDLAREGSGVVVDLASREYWRAVEGRLPPAARVVTIDFRERVGGELRFNSFAAKRARGAMARFLCDHRLDDVAALKDFDGGGYRFDAAASEGDRWRFIRQ